MPDCQDCGDPATICVYDVVYQYSAPLNPDGSINYDLASEVASVADDSDETYYCNDCY